jgi:hypothetical protein
VGRRVGLRSGIVLVYPNLSGILYQNEGEGSRFGIDR